MLVRKHEAVEKAMVGQNSRFEELERFAAELLANQYYNAAGIQKQRDEALGRRDRVREASHQRVASDWKNQENSTSTCETFTRYRLNTILQIG